MYFDAVNNRCKEFFEIQGGYLKNDHGIRVVLTYKMLRFSVQVLFGMFTPQMNI